MTGGSWVHVWSVDPADVTDPELLQRYRKYLDPDERERQGRFVFARHRHEYLVARVLVRTVLSRYESADPAAWHFRLGEIGRPEIDQPATARTLRFNLSHTDGLITCAVTRHHDMAIRLCGAPENRQITRATGRFLARNRDQGSGTNLSDRGCAE